MAALFVEERRKQLAQHLAQAGMAHFIYPFEETFPRNTKRSIRRTGYFSTWQASWFIGHMVLLADCSPFLLPPPVLSVHPAQAQGPGQLCTLSSWALSLGGEAQGLLERCHPAASWSLQLVVRGQQSFSKARAGRQGPPW